LLIDWPLRLEHARMWVSLLGLSGQRVVLGDDLRNLPAERLDLLYPIIPPAAIRSADLYSHRLPDRWVVGATREWRIGESGGVAEPILALGLFKLVARAAADAGAPGGTHAAAFPRTRQPGRRAVCRL